MDFQKLKEICGNCAMFDVDATYCHLHQKVVIIHQKGCEDFERKGSK